MRPDDPRHCSQADTRARKICGPVHPLENPKEFFGRFHVETRAVITNEVDLLAILILDAELDARLIVFAGKLPGIAQKILQGHAQEIGIAFCLSTSKPFSRSMLASRTS